MAKKKRGRKSKYYEIVYPRLEEISKYIQEGASEKDVIEFLGIASSTFYEYKNKYSELAESVEKPKKRNIMNVRNALLKKALGFTYEEKKQYITKDKDTGKEQIRVETYQKYSPPDVGAIAMYLRNNDKDYKEHDQAYYDFKDLELKLKQESQDLNNF